MKEKQFSFVLSAEEFAALHTLAHREEVSAAEWLRACIRRAYDRAGRPNPPSPLLNRSWGPRK